jgi:multiple antibiotic resistance protein
MAGNATPSLVQVWGFFFLLLGPIKIIAPFARMTEGADATFRRRLALRAFLFSTCIVLLAGTMGVQALRNYAVPPLVLALTGGLVLFLVALQGLLAHFNPRPPRAAPEVPPNLQVAAMPLAYPIIVTPSGVAAVIIYMTLAQDLAGKGAIVGLLLALMVLNLLAMLFARPLLRWLGMPLMVFGTVLGVVQAALGLNVMLASLRGLGVIALAPG